MKRIARTLVWWPGLDKDIEERVQCCLECQSNQCSPPLSPLQPWKWPTRPWSRLHADFAGPFMGRMFLIIIDAHSKWLEVHPVTSITSTVTIQHMRTIFSTFGLPEILVTDNGPSFVSREFEEFLCWNGIKHKTTDPYHPASNGLAERAVQIFKKGIRKMQTGTLQDKIARFLFSYRNTPQSTTDTAPAQLLMGRKLRSPLDLLKPDLQGRVEREQEHQKQSHDQHSQVRAFQLEELVFMRNFGQDSSAQPWLPGHIVSSSGPLSYTVQLPDGRTFRRHIDHIRKRKNSYSELDHEQVTSSEFTEVIEPEEAEVVSPVASSDITSNTAVEQTTDEHGTQSAETLATPDNDAPESVRRYPSRTRRPPDRFVPSH